VQLAWSFYVLQNMGFSGTHSFGCYTRGKLARGWERKKKLFNNTFLLDRLKGVQIECSDALKILKLRDAKDDAFHFIDPPYYNSDTRPYAGSYTKEDFIELLKILSRLEGKFLLSSYPSEELKAFTKRCNWYTKIIEKKVTVNHTKSDKGRVKTEVLTANYPI